MKTKLSKRLLSAFLSVLMLVTSLPIASLSAYAITIESTDSAVVEAATAMQAFEDKLQTEGIFTGVEAAYTAYVDCQKAIDAYLYGGEADALTGKAAALNSAVGKITVFSPKKASAVPTFPNSAASDMQSYVNDGTISQILYSSQATVGTGAYAAQVGSRMVLSTDISVLYDGTTAINIPVMVDAYKSNAATPDVNSGKKAAYDKQRHFYACYPSPDSNGKSDDATFQLTGYWRSAGTSSVAISSVANWNSNWLSNDANHDPAYNYATGCATDNKQNTEKRSNDLVVERSGGLTSRKYTSVERYFSNILTYVGSDFSGTGKQYTISGWYASSGQTVNSVNDDKYMGGNTINIVNYKYLIDAMKTNGNKMKTVDPSEYSEGGLNDYIAAMEAAATWDPTTYFKSTNNYQTCVNDMSVLVQNMNGASTNNKNSAAYATLRAAMSEAVRGTYANTNNKSDGTLRYTAESWGNFATAYENAQAVMAQCNDTGYTATNCAALASALTTAYNALETNVQTVDTTALMHEIDTFYTYTNIFTDATYNNAVSVIDTAKATVWGSVGNYGQKDQALPLTTENTEIVATQLSNVKAAIAGLRISMDAKVMTSSGLYSINSALALENNVKDHSDDYGNYSTFTTAIADTQAYVIKADATQFTNYNTQLDEYKNEIVKLVTAYEGLQYSFVKIPNGTVCSTSATTSMTALKSTDQGYQEITFSYSNSGVVLKTSHESATAAYGKAGILFGTNIKSRENNMLDSITINATQPQITTNGGKLHANSGASASSTPKTIDGTTYAGCLSHNNFSLSNIRYVGKSSNNNPVQIFTQADGTAVNDAQVALNNDADALLGTTEGASSNPGKGGFFVRTTDDSIATIEFTANFNYTYPATTAQTLTRNTVPSSATYQLGTKFGAVSIYNCQNTLNYAYYDWFTSEMTGETINTSCTVVDISNLTDLVTLCNRELADGANKYTEATWDAFTKALVAAQADMNYKLLSASQIVSQSVTRYQNLWDAKEALVVRDVPSTFNFKDASGKDTSVVINTKYGEVIDMTAVNAIVTPEYSDDNFSYTFASWSPAVSTSPMTVDRVYTAQYNRTERVADFAAFDAALQAVRNQLVDKALGVSVLQSAAASITSLSPDYIHYTAEQKAATKNNEQSAIDAQTATLNQIAADLAANAAVIATIDYAAAEAQVEAESRKYNNDDMFTGDNIKLGKLQQSVNILDADVLGQIYETQLDVDAAVSNAINSKAIRTYTIYVNGTACGSVEYGTPVVVDSDGTVHANAADLDANTEGMPNVAWFYSYAAPSNNNVPSNETYIISSPSYGFIVKGDTYLRTEATTVQDTGYTVTFKANVGGKVKTFDVKYVTDGQVTMPAAPAYAFYTFSGYSNGAAAGASVSVTSNMTITANYAVKSETSYTVDFYDGLTAFASAEITSSATYGYNKLVSVTASAVPYLWAIADYIEDAGITELRIVAYGSDTYSFYACQDLSNGGFRGIVALSESDYQTITTDAAYALYDTNGDQIVAEGDELSGYVYPDPKPAVSVLQNVIRIYNSDSTLNKMSLIGTFSLPEGYTMVETGFLFTSQVGNSMTLEEVGKNGIVRMKAARYTVGNQFVVNVGAPSSTVSFEYVGYAVVKDAMGKTSTIYSTKGGETNFDPTV